MNRLRNCCVTYGLAAGVSLLMVAAGSLLWLRWLRLEFEHPPVYFISLGLLVLIRFAFSCPTKDTHGDPTVPVRLLDWCRDHVFRTSTAVLGTLALVLVLLWEFLSSDFETADTQSYIFLSITAVVAVVAAVNSVLSSMSARESTRVANDSLQLTRATQRPFLNVSEPRVGFSRQDEEGGQVQYLVFGITNTGVFPADGVTVRASIRYGESTDEAKALRLVSGPRSPTCFPNEEFPNVRFVDPDAARPVVPPNSTVSVRIAVCYSSKVTGNDHKTYLEYLVQNAMSESDRVTPGNSYWD